MKNIDNTIYEIANQCGESFLSTDGSRKNNKTIFIYGAEECYLDLMATGLRNYFSKRFSEGEKKAEGILIKRGHGTDAYSIDLGALLKMNKFLQEEENEKSR